MTCSGSVGATQARPGTSATTEPGPVPFDPGLAGRRAVVMGAGPGIGLATAVLFSQLGARVVVGDVDPARAKEALEQLTGDGHGAHLVDARDELAVRDFAERVTQEHGEVDVLVNVVGHGGPPGGVAELGVPVWDEVIELNLRQQFLVARAFLPAMLRRGRGSIVAVSSINAIMSSPLRAAYGVAKAGLDSLVRTLAIEGAASGVRANCVRPGATLTPRRRHLGQGDLGDRYREEIPLGRLGEARDVANAVVFLASDLARHITGEALVVDGGSTIRYSQPAGY